MNSVQALNVI